MPRPHLTSRATKKPASHSRPTHQMAQPPHQTTDGRPRQTRPRELHTMGHLHGNRPRQHRSCTVGMALRRTSRLRLLVAKPGPQQARRMEDTMKIADLRKHAIEAEHRHFQEQLPANNCERLTIRNDNGDSFKVPCQTRSCPQCGPIKQTTLKHSIETGIGQIIYIHRYETWDEVDHILAAAKKRKQRGGNNFTYTSVGDDYYGYYLITNIPIDQHQRRMTLKDWWDRIKVAYTRAGRRMRRSAGMSRLTLYRKTKSGHSSWRPVFGRDKQDESVQSHRFEGVDTWDEMLDVTLNDQKAFEEAQELDEMWRMSTNVSPMPRRQAQQDLPDPY